MNIKAKFRCNSVVDADYGNGFTTRNAHFTAIYGKEGENAGYSKATPSGSLTIQIDKETAAYEAFKPGQS
jgi:hypothetical protein